MERSFQTLPSTLTVHIQVSRRADQGKKSQQKTPTYALHQLQPIISSCTHFFLESQDSDSAVSHTVLTHLTANKSSSLAGILFSRETEAELKDGSKSGAQGLILRW